MVFVNHRSGDPRRPFNSAFSILYTHRLQVYWERLGLLDYPYYIFVLGVCICSRVYVCVHTKYVCTCVPVSMHLCMWSPEVEIRYPPPFQGSSYVFLLRAGIKCACYHDQLFVWVTGIQTRDLMLRVSILPTEPSSYPYKIYCFVCFVFTWALFVLGIARGIQEPLVLVWIATIYKETLSFDKDVERTVRCSGGVLHSNMLQWAHIWRGSLQSPVFS